MDKGHLSGDLLCDLAEGQLAPDARREAEAHVEGCADCRRELEALQGYFQDMSSLETLKAPDRFLTRVHARIDKASPWKRLLAALSSPRLMPVPVAAFCLMMVGAFLFYLSRKAGQESPQTVALSAPVRPAESASEIQGDEGRVATIPQNRYALSSPKKRSAESPDRNAPVNLASRSVRVPAAEAKANAAPEDAAIPKTVARASAKNKVSTISGRKGKVAVEAGEPTSTGSGSAQADAAAIPAQPAELALAAPSPSRAEKAMAASKPEAVASPLADSEVSGRMAERDEAIAFAEPGAARGKRESAAPAPPSVTPKPWAPMAYTLEWRVGRADAAAFRPGLDALGIRVLRQEQGSADRYELEVPAVKVAKLEEYLRGYGTLAPAPASLPGRKNGAPIRMTLRVTRTP